MAKQQEDFTDRVTLGADGKYRWVYTLNLYKNPTVYVLVWSIFFVIILAIFAVVLLSDAIRWDDFYPTRLVGDLKALGYAMAGMTALTGLGYLVYAAMMGGKYIVEFEMDQQGVLHRQTAAQAKKARKIGGATAASGLATGSLTRAGIGANAQRTEMYSDFAATRRVKACPRRHLVKVNARLSHNQVYAPAEDYDFVKNYIVEHCPNARH